LRCRIGRKYLSLCTTNYIDSSSIGINSLGYNKNYETIQSLLTKYTNSLTKAFTYDFATYYNETEATIVEDSMRESKVLIDNIHTSSRILEKQIDSINVIQETTQFGLFTFLHIALTIVLSIVVIGLNKRLNTRYDKTTLLTILFLLPALAFGKFTSNCTNLSETQVCRLGKYDACHLIAGVSQCYCAPTNNYTMWSEYDDCIAPGLALTTWNSFNKHISHDINYQNFFIYLILIISILQLILFYFYVRPIYFRNFPSERNFVTNIRSKFKDSKRKLPIFNNKSF